MRRALPRERLRRTDRTRLGNRTRRRKAVCGSAVWRRRRNRRRGPLRERTARRGVLRKTRRRRVRRVVPAIPRVGVLRPRGRWLRGRHRFPGNGTGDSSPGSRRRRLRSRRRRQGAAQRSGKPGGLRVFGRTGRSRGLRRWWCRALDRVGQLTGEPGTGQAGTGPRSEARDRAAELGSVVAGRPPAGARLAALLLVESRAEVLDAFPEDERIPLGGQLGELRPEVEASRSRSRPGCNTNPRRTSPGNTSPGRTGHAGRRTRVLRGRARCTTGRCFRRQRPPQRGSGRR